MEKLFENYTSNDKQNIVEIIKKIEIRNKEIEELIINLIKIIL